MKRKDDKTQRFELGATINVRRDDVDRLKNISKGDLENVNIGLGSDIGIGLGNAFSNGSAIMQAINNNREKRFNQLSEIGNEIQNEIDRLENDKELKRNIETQNLEIAKNIEREIQLAKKQNMQLRAAINLANKKPSDISKINVKNENGYANLSSPTNEEFVSFNRKNSKNKATNDIRNNIQSRADALYGSDEEYYKKYPKKEDKFSLYPKTAVDSEGRNYYKVLTDNYPIEKLMLFRDKFKITKEILNSSLKAIEKLEFEELPFCVIKEIISSEIINQIELASIVTLGFEATENLLMSKKEQYLNTLYAKDLYIIDNYKMFKEKTHELIERKLVGIKDKDRVKCVIVPPIYSKRIYKNEEIKSLIEQYSSQLKQNNHINTSINFDDRNLHNAIGAADIVDMHINKNQEIEFSVLDLYDFNTGDKRKTVMVGKELQDKGVLVPYLIIYRVVIPQKISECYLNKKEICNYDN